MIGKQKRRYILKSFLPLIPTTSQTEGGLSPLHPGPLNHRIPSVGLSDKAGTMDRDLGWEPVRQVV